MIKKYIIHQISHITHQRKMSSIPVKKVSFNTAIAVVVANMIGAGVFTSLGYQTVAISSIFPLLMLWIVGGVIALCGALNYGELAALMPRSGGEYNFLSRIYHPLVGFVSGWISATVGFAAPVALAAVALGRYASAIIPINPLIISISVVVLVTLVHATDTRTGGIFQRYSTAIKVILILFLIFSGLIFTAEPVPISILPKEGDMSLIFFGGFATNLAYVSFAYSGWNASAYLANEIENPKVNVPKSLFLGTFSVMLIYVLLTFVFLYTVPVSELAAGQAADFSKPLEVGHLSAEKIFGKSGGNLMAGMIALLLISSISAMVFAGPRVTQMIGEDFPLLKKFATTNEKGVPVIAIMVQAIISIALILTASFDTVLKAMAFVLDIFTFLAVLGVIILRIKQPNAERSYKAWGYPITTLIFLVSIAWVMYFLFMKDILPSIEVLLFLKETKNYVADSIPAILSFGAILSGILVYFVNKKMESK